jgi:hypothetical protein
MIQSKEYTGSVKKKKKMENAMALIAIVKLPLPLSFKPLDGGLTERAFKRHDRPT